VAGMALVGRVMPPSGPKTPPRTPPRPSSRGAPAPEPAEEEEEEATVTPLEQLEREVLPLKEEIGQVVRDAIPGHGEPALCVSLEPSEGGARVRLAATGSADATCCVWDVTSGGLVARLEGHADSVCSVAWCPSDIGQSGLLATGSLDRTIRTWDLWSGEELFKVAGCWQKMSLLPPGEEGHRAPVTSVAFAPDGKRLASASNDATVRLWRVRDGGELKHRAFLEGGHAPAAVRDVHWRPCGRYLASGGVDSRVVVWGMEGKKGPTIGPTVVLEGHDSAVCRVRWSPDGRRLASTSHDRTVRVWRFVEGKKPRVLAVLRAHEGIVHGLAWSPGGDRLASGGGAADGGAVFVWDTSHFVPSEGRGPAYHFRGHEPTLSVTGLDWMPDGSALVSCGVDGGLRLWDTASEHCHHALAAHTRDVMCVGWSSNGQRLASGGRDSRVNVWEVRSGNRVVELVGHGDYVTCCAWSPGGALLATSSLDGSCRLWDTDNWSELEVLRHDGPWGSAVHVNGCAFNAKTTRVVTGCMDGTVRIWRIRLDPGMEGLMPSSKSLALIFTYRADLSAHPDLADGSSVPRAFPRPVLSVMYSPNAASNLLAVLEEGASFARLWDLVHGIPVATLQGPKEGEVSATSMAWSPDGSTVALGFPDVGEAWLFDATKGTGVPFGTPLMGNVNDFYGVSFSPDGSRLAGCARATPPASGCVRVWLVSNGELLGTVWGAKGSLNAVAYPPTQQNGGDEDSGTPPLLAAAGEDGLIRLWDAHLGKDEVLLSTISYSPRGDIIAGGSWNWCVYVWDAQDGSERLRLRGHKGRVSSLAFSGSGGKIVSGSRDATVRIWLAASPLEGTKGREAAEPVERACVVLQGHEAPVTGVAWSTNDSLVVSTSEDASARVWSVLSEPPLCKHVIPLGAPGLCVAMCPLVADSDGGLAGLGSIGKSAKTDKVAVGCSDGGFTICDPSSSNVLSLQLGGEGKGSIVSVAWSPDGKRLATASADRKVRVWLYPASLDAEVQTEISRHSPSFGSVVGWEGVMWPEEMKWLKLSANKGVRHNAAHPSPHHGRPTAWRYERERGGLPPSGSQSPGRKSPQALAEESALFPSLASDEGADEFPCSLAWDDSGRLLASAWTDATVRVHDATQGHLLAAFAGHAASVTSVSWHPIHKRLASAGADHHVCCWDLDGVDPVPSPDSSEIEDE